MRNAYSVSEHANRIFVLLFGIAFFVLPHVTHAADLSFSPASGSFPIGTDFSVTVFVNPAGDSVNAADGTVSFDKDVLSVTSVSKDGSAFSLWTAEPSFSNAAGTVTFSGGTPSAFSGQGKVITVKFKGKQVGSAGMSFSNASILAADGKGTDVYSSGGQATFTITEAVNKPEPKPATAPDPVAAGGATPLAPVITSSSHGKPNKWYATSTAKFSWKPTSDVTGVRTLLSKEKDSKPDDVQESSAASQVVTDIEDGEWYFYVQFKNDFGWGEIASKEIRVDTVAPSEFDFTLSEQEGSPPAFMFQTDDDLSGMNRYEISINGRIAASVRAQDLKDGTHPVPPQEGGLQLVAIKAYDNAGNVTEIEKELTLPLVEKASAKKEEPESDTSTWTIERFIVILFALIIGALGSWIVYSRKDKEEERMAILQDVLDVREQNDKIFSAMREEFDEMVHELDIKPQLTPNERDFLERIKEILDISEGLVDSSIEELKDTVRGK